MDKFGHRVLLNDIFVRGKVCYPTSKSNKYM